MAGKTSPNGTRYCRTCGFSDCPGKDTGNCPRWPGRAIDENAERLGGHNA